MKNWIAMTLALTTAAGLMTGCSSGEESSAGSASSAGDGPVTIEFWHSMGSTTGELIQEIVDEFNASQDEVYVEAIYQGDTPPRAPSCRPQSPAETPPRWPR